MIGRALQRYIWIFLLILLIWTVQAVNMLSDYSLNQFLGLEPRRLTGLDGILTMPLLHASTEHALTNTGPVFILGAIVTLVARNAMVLVTAMVIGFGGGLLWVFGRDAVHVGASGLVFGWFGFLAVRGLIDRSTIAIVASIGVVLIYGAMLWGVLPGQRGVSWESHLFGAIAGITAAIVTPVASRLPARRRSSERMSEDR